MNRDEIIVTTDNTPPMPGARPIAEYTGFKKHARQTEFAARDFSAWGPRPRDLPEWRRALIPHWRPGGHYWQLQQVLKDYGRGGDFSPLWEVGSLKDAELWFVGDAMCDLLVGAAQSMPDEPLHPNDIPDSNGFVVFQKVLAGIDAEDSGIPVTVGAYLWGPAIWRGDPVLAITVYGPFVFPGTELESPWLHPLGALTWSFGEGADAPVAGNVVTDASMAEDRRRLRAMWRLANEPGIASNVRHEPQIRNRKKAKRVASGRSESPQAVRVIRLRRQPPPTRGERAPGRTYTHRWTVSGFWRHQACGPMWSDHKLIYVNPFLKGPEGAPVKTGERVKAWTR